MLGLLGYMTFSAALFAAGFAFARFVARSQTHFTRRDYETLEAEIQRYRFVIEVLQLTQQRDNVRRTTRLLQERVELGPSEVWTRTAGHLLQGLPQIVDVGGVWTKKAGHLLQGLPQIMDVGGVWERN